MAIALGSKTKKPLQHKAGRAFFMDFKFSVTLDTLIPRPETEILVEKTLNAAMQCIKEAGCGYRVHILDIGTGCGNIAISLTKYLEQSKITALDISLSALTIAKQNALDMAVKERIHFIAADMMTAFKKQSMFDIIVSNPPYVSERDMGTLPDQVRTEPHSALYGGEEGLDFYRILSDHASSLLKKNGILIVEIGYDQAVRVKKILEGSGYSDICIYKDYNSIDRIIEARAR